MPARQSGTAAAGLALLTVHGPQDATSKEIIQWAFDAEYQEFKGNNAEENFNKIRVLP
jgi:hypothetical protein